MGRRGVVTPPYGGENGADIGVPVGDPSVTAAGRDCSCCGAQNSLLAYARRILTAATRSPRCICPRQRSARSPFAQGSLALRGDGGSGGHAGPPLII